MVLKNINFPEFNILMPINPTFKPMTLKNSTSNATSFSYYRRGGGTERSRFSVLNPPSKMTNYLGWR